MKKLFMFSKNRRLVFYIKKYYVVWIVFVRIKDYIKQTGPISFKRLNKVHFYTASVASEKLFGLPSENLRNYQQSNLLYRMGAVEGEKLVVFHGLKDS